MILNWATKENKATFYAGDFKKYNLSETGRNEQ